MHLKHSYPAFIFWFCVGWGLGILPAVAFVAGFTMGTQQTKILGRETTTQVLEIAGVETVATNSADIFQSIVTPTSIPTVVITPQATSSIMTSPLWDALNKYRANHGLSVFVRDVDLCQLSNTRLTQIQLSGLSHDGFNVLLPTYIHQKGFKRMGEVLSHGYEDASEIINHWDNSPQHHAILTDPVFNRACEASGGGYAVVVTGQQ